VLTSFLQPTSTPGANPMSDEGFTCSCVLHTHADTLDALFDHHFIEHDAYFMFERIMCDVSLVYTHTLPTPGDPTPACDIAALSEKVQTGME
jgi:hypothetical protein